MNKLTIRHNHGELVLQDAITYETKEGYRYAKGICIGGGVTNRLFHATNYQPFPVGVSQSWCIGSSTIYGNENDGFYVDATFF